MANLRAFAELFKKYSPRRSSFNILQNTVATLVFIIHLYRKATTRQSHTVLNGNRENGEKQYYWFKGFQGIYSASGITILMYTLQLLSNLN